MGRIVEPLRFPPRDPARSPAPKPKRFRITGTERILAHARRRGWTTRWTNAVIAGFFTSLVLATAFLVIGRTNPIGGMAAFAAFLEGFVVSVFMVWIVVSYASFVPGIILRRRIDKAGFDREATRFVAAVAVEAHGPATLLWRIPPPDFLDGVPVDPAKQGWTFVRLLHRYQDPGRSSREGGETPASRARRRARNGWIAIVVCFGLAAIWPVGAGIANIPGGKSEREWESVRTLMAPARFAELSEARQQRILEVALRRTEVILAANPADSTALRIAARAAEGLGDSEAAEGYRQREARARGVPVPAAAPEPEAGP